MQKQISVAELKSQLLDQGYIGIYFCDFESVDNGVIEHYSLLKAGEQPYPGCSEDIPTPLLSDYGTSILQRYLDKVIVIDQL